MKPYDYSKNPLYKDRALDNPQWSKVLFGSKPIQASELIEIQTIQQKNLHRSLSTLFSNGSVLRGLQPIVKDLGDSLEVYLTDGLFYFEGFTLAVPGKTFYLSKAESFTIYVNVEESIITEKEDATLRDIATGGELYGLPGASRLLWTASLVIEQETPYPVLEVEKGLIHRKPSISERDRVIYERYGNFVVEGLDITSINSIPTSTNEEDSNKSLDEKKEGLVLLKSQERKEDSILRSLRLEFDYLSSLSSLSSTNKKRFEDLHTLLENQESKVEELKERVLSLQAELYKLSLETIETEKDLQKTLKINPGIAYIFGSRVEKSSVSTLTLSYKPQEIEVAGRSFLHSKNRPFNLRSISYGTNNNNLQDLLYVGFTLYFSFTNLSFGSDTLTVRVSITYDEKQDFLHIEDVLEDVVYHLTTSSPIEERVKYSTSFSQDLNPYLLRSVLQENLDFHVVSSNSISIESLTSNDIRLDTTSSNDVLVFNKETSHINHLSSNEQRSYYLEKEVKSAKVLGIQKEIEYPITRSSTSHSDLLPDDSVSSILSIKQGDTTYIEGRDYYLNLNMVNWNTEHAEAERPSNGTTYYCTFLYTKTLDHSIEDGYLRFVGDEPLDGSIFYVDFTYYEPKLINLYLDNKGEFSSNPTYNSLLLATIKLGFEHQEVEYKAPKRWSSEEIFSLKEELLKNRDSIKMLKDSIREMEDPSFSLVGSPEIDEVFSSYVINRSSQSFSLPLKRTDLVLGDERVILDYSISQYKKEEYVVDVLEIEPIPSEYGFLNIEPPLLLTNEDQNQALETLGEIRNAWEVKVDTRDYLDDEQYLIKYELEHGLPKPNKEVYSNQNIKLKAIGLPPDMSGFLVFVDNMMVARSSYVNEDQTSYSANSLRTNREGEIHLSLSGSFTVGTHLVEIKNTTHTCSSYFSVIDVGKTSSYITSLYKWDRSLNLDVKDRPLYPANKETERIPSVLQQFRVKYPITLSTVGLYMEGEASIVLGQEEKPSILSEAKFTRKVNDISFYALERPTVLLPGITYYIGLKHYETISVGLAGKHPSDLLGLHIDYPLRLTDGYKGYALETSQLSFSLNQMAFQSEKLINIGEFTSSKPIKAFSINSLPFIPSGASVEFYYESGSNLIEVKPFYIEKLGIETNSVTILAKLKGTLDVSPEINLRASSISLLTESESQFTLQSKSLPYTNNFGTVVAIVEHVGLKPESVWLSVDGYSWFKAHHFFSEEGTITTSKYKVDIANTTGKLFYKVVSTSDIRNVRLGVH